jgi:glutamine synthetase
MTPAMSSTLDTARTDSPDTSSLLPASRLARLLGTPAPSWTADDLAELFVSQRLRLVNLMHVGGDGWLKTLDFVPRDRAHLRDVLTSGERADGSSLFGMLGVNVAASDVVLRPRLETAFLDPFGSAPALAVLCGHFGRDAAPLPESPDTIVRRAAERLQQECGVQLQALGEVEFFLGKRPEESDIYGATERGYHASSPFVFGESLRRQALVVLAEMGVPVKYGHSEVGYIQPDEGDNRIWEQHEVELALQPLPAAADAVVLAHWVLRNLAHQRGLRCSFDPIIRQGHAGSGLHFHLSPWVGGTPRPVSRSDETLEPESAAIVAGLVTSAGALMAFGNRTANSFVRLGQAREAPNRVTWGRFNRKALIRLPVVPRDAQGNAVSPETVEFRLPDGSAHPHLLLAGVAQAMLHGRALEPIALASLLARTAATAQGPDALPVPRAFNEVADALRHNRAMLEAGGVFPAHVVDRIIATLAQ